MSWTDERVDLLKRLWMDGNSASQIAAQLGDGVTRNAVIGKVHRLKLSQRAKPATAPRTRAPARGAPRRPSAGFGGRSSSTSLAAGLIRRRVIGPSSVGATALAFNEELDVEPFIAQPQVAELYVPESERLSLLQLSEKTCKWPIGDPLTPEFYFCGQHPNEGSPYCEFHARRAYHQADKKKR